MNYARLVLAIVAAAVLVIGFDITFHGIYMKSDYQATAALWRTDAQMQAMMIYMTAGQVLTAVVAALLFTQLKGHCMGYGIKLGLLLGLLAAASSIMWYVIIPVPVDMVCKWVVGGFVSSLLVGIVLALIYKPITAE